MSGPLDGRHVLLGVTGSVAAYKAAEVCSRLVQAGAQVDVAMTREAAEFIQPLTFRALTGHPPYIDIFRDGAEGEAQHDSGYRQAARPVKFSVGARRGVPGFAPSSCFPR